MDKSLKFDESDKFIGGMKGRNFGKFFKPNHFLNEVCRKKIVFFGELVDSQKSY